MSWFHCLRKLAPSGTCAWWWILWVVLIEATPLSLTARRKLHNRLLNWYVCSTARMTKKTCLYLIKHCIVNQLVICHPFHTCRCICTNICWLIQIQHDHHKWLQVWQYQHVLNSDWFLFIHSATTMKFDQVNTLAFASLWPIIDCLLVPSPRVKQKSKLLKNLQRLQVSYYCPLVISS